MPDSRLSGLQIRILRALAGMEPAWTLTGGAALAGFHSKHRTTRDLDLLWRGQGGLGDLGREVARRLHAAGFEVEVLQSTAALQRLNVRDRAEACVLDLVAEPVASLEPPVRQTVEGASIQIDSRHEILVNKLCALLSRSELRDLVDVEVLLGGGGDLKRALSDAPRKDSGFSPLTLAWVLKGLPVRTLARGLDFEETAIRDLEAFQAALADRLAAGAEPRPPDLTA